VLVLLLVAAACYVPALGDDFHFDDEGAVVTNRYVADPGSSFGWHSFVPSSLVLERPLTQATFALNRALAGLRPQAFVATNVAIHLAAAVLVWAFARLTLRRSRHPRADGIALCVAGVFALHPLQSQAVSYVSQRAESLASVLYVAALLLLLRAEETLPGRRGWVAVLGAAATFIAAFAAKPIALTLPAAYVLHAATVGGSAGATWRRRMSLIAPFLVSAIALAYSLVTGLSGSAGAGATAGTLGPWRYFLTEQEVLLRYLRLVLWPTGQTIDHLVRESPGLLDLRTVASLAVVAATISGALWLRWRAPRLPDAPAARVIALGIVWFFVLLAPTSSFVPLADPMFEHRTYLANVGVFMAALVAGDLVLARVLAARANRARVAIAAALWCALAGALAVRNRVWSSDVALWTDAVAKTPESPRSQYNLGFALREAGRLQPALASFRRAAELQPSGTRAWAGTQELVGEVLLDLRRPAEAAPVLEAALAAAPDRASLHATVAWLRYQTGDVAGAEHHARAALAMAPDNANAMSLAGRIALEQGDLGSALARIGRAAELEPGNRSRHLELAHVLVRAGRVPEACAAWYRFLPLARDPHELAQARKTMAGLGCGRR